MSREREIRRHVADLGDKESWTYADSLLVRAIAIIDEQRAEIERLKIPKGGYEEMCAKLTRSLDECAAENRRLRVRIDYLEITAGEETELIYKEDAGG